MLFFVLQLIALQLLNAYPLFAVNCKTIITSIQAQPNLLFVFRQ